MTTGITLIAIGAALRLPSRLRRSVGPNPMDWGRVGLRHHFLTKDWRCQR